mmetsp:Transcript_51301/g.133254  ORF Transcript_51301/g.133254 Transcript_51301/m.133254 type:complete len:289 (+) Transcript_51301:40-906(+)|eukprot:CAMPEP_0115854404 /NCGR_PEP_ID=MMETSP0287-20121206/14007_1 /TAXON_ID=412157 /ORGANISM="Chrysochromulina rotalis, Strain UIO044" /LENGTH=288 /DNA_ID=CAMNT_0003308521 /DNA_START=31 /DNA_END=897 /DNA_ORIENTATION=+
MLYVASLLAAALVLPQCAPVRPLRAAIRTNVVVANEVATSPSVVKCTTAKWGEQTDREAAAMARLAELEKEFSSSSVEPDDVKKQLLGFWKLLIADPSDELITQGMTGYGAPSHNTVLAHFQLFQDKNPQDDLQPTMQTVEVISNRAEGRAAIASLKGDFYVGRLQGGSEIGVVEEYMRIEYAGDSRYDASIEPERWTCALLSPSLRVCRLEGGLTRVYAKVEATAAQAEIARLMATKVEATDDADGGEDEDDPNDERPLWQKRLDKEAGRGPGERGNRFGPIQSDIP